MISGAVTLMERLGLSDEELMAVLDAGAPPAEVTRNHVLAVDALVVAWRGQQWIDLPGPLRAVRRDGRLVFERPAAPAPPPPA